MYFWWQLIYGISYSKVINCIYEWLPSIKISWRSYYSTFRWWWGNQVAGHAMQMIIRIGHIWNTWCIYNIHTMTLIFEIPLFWKMLSITYSGKIAAINVSLPHLFWSGNQWIYVVVKGARKTESFLHRKAVTSRVTSVHRRWSVGDVVVVVVSAVVSAKYP